MYIALNKNKIKIFYQKMFSVCAGLCLTVLLFIPKAISQEGEGGVDSPFTIGVGARALAMGSAAVAFPDDPSAFAWNPAGMVVVPQKSIALTLTTLFEGTQYNFIGYVHPTMNLGTFGLGVVRVGADGIVHRYWSGDGGAMVEAGEMSYWWGKFSIA